MMPSKGFAVGGHVSTRGGFLKAAERAVSTGGGAFQYFPKNPRSLALKKLNESDAKAAQAFTIQHNLMSIAHTPYPSNPAIGRKKGEDAYQALINSILNDLEIAESCGSMGIVLHYGHIQSGDSLEGYRNIIFCLDEVLERWEGSARILLENQAGDHGPMGTMMEELVQVRNLCRYPEKVGFCMDTCHAYAAGWWNGGPDKAMLEKGNKLGFWKELGAVHLNDSKYPARSRKDRHERVGKGYIGKEGFLWLLEMDWMYGIPVILESETGADGTHREDIAQVIKWEKERPER
ncbi:deoxyribonuclease IV [Paenibacillus sp. JX-17]|uniref:Deoxyribonuclease IV n=1 Tax=Paenibacillus lacisoli TaxID=3064525 RepID=A0ABT9CB65_9BACL|nr:deoxyribonuclease IV [Paenibacillus sp. JX-17]MDO7904931.1 deoxyribonuclease IV [Paenibacillus sp. JX-17]